MSAPPPEGSDQSQQDSPEQPQPVSNIRVGVQRSGESDHRCYVRFVNTTHKTVKLIWLDFKGEQVKYRNLNPETAHSVVTYHSHPWIFLDSETNERLAIKRGSGKVNYFESTHFLSALRTPSPDSYSPEDIDDFWEGRRLFGVLIQLPIDNLRYSALQTVRKCLKRKEDCFALEVPQKVQFELARTFG